MSNKQFYKIQEDGTLYALKQNDIVGGVGISNVDFYFNNHPEIANSKGWYEMAETQDEVPTFDPETQTITTAYSVVDNKIVISYSVEGGQDE